MKKIKKNILWISVLAASSIAIATPVAIISCSKLKKENKEFNQNKEIALDSKTPLQSQNLLSQNHNLNPTAPAKRTFNQWRIDFPQYSGRISFDDEKNNYVSASAFADEVLPNNFYLPDDITALGTESFKGAILPKGFVLPDSVKDILPRTFAYSIIPDDFSLPTKITEIDDYAFTGAIIGNNFSMPGVKTINTHSFENVQFRGSIDLSSVVNVGDFAFDGIYCETHYLPTILATGKIGVGVFDDYIGLENSVIKWRIDFPQFANKITLKNEVITNGFYGVNFNNVKSISGKEFYLPEGLTTINENGFAKAIFPNNFVLPSSLIELKTMAFYGAQITNNMKDWFNDINRRKIMKWSDIRVFKHSNVDNQIRPPKGTMMFFNVPKFSIDEVRKYIQWDGIDTHGKWEVDDETIMSKYHITLVPEESALINQHKGSQMNAWGSLKNGDPIRFHISREEDWFFEDDNQIEDFSATVSGLVPIIRNDSGTAMTKDQLTLKLKNSIKIIGASGMATWTNFNGSNAANIKLGDFQPGTDTPSEDNPSRLKQLENNYYRSSVLNHSMESHPVNALETSGNQIDNNNYLKPYHVEFQPDQTTSTSAVQWNALKNGDHLFFNTTPIDGFVFDPIEFPGLYNPSIVKREDIISKTPNGKITSKTASVDLGIGTNFGHNKDLPPLLVNEAMDVNEFLTKIQDFSFLDSGISSIATPDISKEIPGASLQLLTDGGWKLQDSSKDGYDTEYRVLFYQVNWDFANYAVRDKVVTQFQVKITRRINYVVQQHVVDVTNVQLDFIAWGNDHDNPTPPENPPSDGGGFHPGPQGVA